MEKCFLRNHFDKTASQNAGISDAREVKGKTKSFSPNLVVSAVATDGSSVTVPVTVVRTVRLATGQIRSSESVSCLPDSVGQKLTHNKVRLLQKIQTYTDTL